MRYFISTFGCQANEADSERIKSRLEAMGHKKTLNKRRADLIVINACSVRQSAVDRVYGKIREFKGKKIILTGCLLPSDKKKLQKKVFAIWHPDEYFNEAPLYENKTSALVPIMTGCNNFCTYCAVPHTRGKEKSRPAKDVIKEVKKLIREGCKEIWLLGQNVNSYKSGRITFPKLLQYLNTVVDKCAIQFMSPHPKDFSDELINTIAKCDSVIKYINLPVQSGDNEILRKMNRNYTREQYIKLVNKIRKKIPEIKISTDAIVGFPGETKKQFQNTLQLFKKIGFDKAYISRYSPRPGTVAAILMKDGIPHQEKKRRWKILDQLVNKNKKTKIIVVLGPTASGKSGLAVALAKKFNGEIISADSRQVYKGMDVGTGKITQRGMKGIKHYLLDMVSPKKIFTALNFKKQAEVAIAKIVKKGKTPIICGGTGFYIHALLGGTKIPEVKPDWKLRKELEKKSAEELFKMLKNGRQAEKIDRHNKRRLIRAIEISRCGVAKLKLSRLNLHSFDILWLGIKKTTTELKKSIDKRVDKMIELGLEKEVKKLVKKYGWTKVLRDTIGYKEWGDDNPAEKIKRHSIQYAKRQMTWFKKYAHVTKWLKNKKEAFDASKQFLTDKHGYQDSNLE